MLPRSLNPVAVVTNVEWGIGRGVWLRVLCAMGYGLWAKFACA